MNPTPEQAACEAAFAKPDRPNLQIRAYAGCGKSTTLRMLGFSRKKQGIYIVFNKRNATEAQASFPANVACSTMHSLAFRAANGPGYMPKINNKMPSYELARALGVIEMMGIGKAHIAAQVRDAVGRFQQSDSAIISVNHAWDATRGFNYFRRYHMEEQGLFGPEVTPPLNGYGCPVDPVSTLSPADKAAVESLDRYRQYIAEVAARYWERSIDLQDTFTATHDTYLKLWQLSKPVLRGIDFLMVDEWQDTSRCAVDVVRNQQTQTVVVGDSFQAIYKWRGAIDAMDQMGDATELWLPQSFRFGDALAEVANAILGVGYELAVPIRGNPQRNSEIGKVEGQYTVICRTNAGVFMEAVAAIDAGLSLSVIGSLREPVSLVRSVYALSINDRRRVDHHSIKPFDTFEDLKAEAEYDTGLSWVVNFVGRNTDRIEDMCDQLEQSGETRPEKADRVLTTAHKAKGLEWPQVRLANDYCNDFPEQPTDLETITVDDLNLLYVASTRALDRLEPNALVRRILGEDCSDYYGVTKDEGVAA